MAHPSFLVARQQCKQRTNSPRLQVTFRNIIAQIFSIDTPVHEDSQLCLAACHGAAWLGHKQADVLHRPVWGHRFNQRMTGMFWKGHPP